MNKITKEEWLNIRNTTQLPLNLYWEVFEEKTGKTVPYETFEKIFPKWAISSLNAPTLNSNYEPVRFSMEKAIEIIYKHFDEKFNV